MIKVQFISVQTLKSKSILQDNVDEKILNLAIQEFQELELANMLGNDEYIRLQNVQLGAVAEPPVALIPGDVEKMTYITPVMIYGALMYSISPIHRKFTNAGVKEDAYLNSVSSDLAAARADYAFKLDGYKRKLIEFYQGLNADANAITCKGSADTTFNFTGMAMPDSQPPIEDYYNNRYYKDSGNFGLIL